MTRHYRALIMRAGGAAESEMLHLVRDESEASLCGIPKVSLGTGEIGDGIVCPACIEWLPRRAAHSAMYRKIDRGQAKPS